MKKTSLRSFFRNKFIKRIVLAIIAGAMLYTISHIASCLWLGALSHRFIKTNGVIMRLEHRGRVALLAYKYFTPQGVKIGSHYKGCEVCMKCLQVGQKVEVYYNPLKLNEAVLVKGISWLDGLMLVIVLGGVGLSFNVVYREWLSSQ